MVQLGDVVRFGRKTEYQVVGTELTGATFVDAAQPAPAADEAAESDRIE